ncbi:MAG: flagellar biosynthesis protein FlhA [Candidatus Xenobiia bacterium LiM19]
MAENNKAAEPVAAGGSTRSDLLVIGALILIFVMMIIPIPPFLLDVFYTINIALCLVILVSSMYLKEPLSFSIFPSLLLVITLFRLSLNVSGSRAILLHGFAGHVIDTFGQFVVGGNYVVGLIIFLILVIIQFVVITNGAQRVAEVAARFTLDAMPGKQMSIDADLNTGLITPEDAKRRRREIEREADFYGSMDGAGKFIRGDAIAAVIIIIINILGGFIIGVVQKGLPIIVALQKYTLLTIGEGLVTQIPALLISTATGLVVTRAASDYSMGQDAEKQLFGQSKTLYVVSAILLAFAIVPGFPKVPFIALAVGMYFLAKSIRKEEDAPKPEKKDEQQPEKKDDDAPEEMYQHLSIEPIELELGYSLINLIDPERGGDLLKRIVQLRRSFAGELGLVVPPIRIRDNISLKANAYSIKIFDQVIGKGEVFIGKFMALGGDGNDDVADIDGIKTREPAFGLPALWISENDREKAELFGYTVIDCSSVIATHISELIKSYSHDILTRQDVQNLIDNLKATYPVIVNELLPNILKVGDVQKVLQNLLREGISIKNLRLILETLGDYATASKDVAYLTNQVRIALARAICEEYKTEENVIPVITLSPRVESVIFNALSDAQQGDTFGALSPDTLRKLYTNLTKAVEKVTSMGYQPIVLCAGAIRLPFKRLTERVIKKLVVLSYNEIEYDYTIEALEVLDIDIPDARPGLDDGEPMDLVASR